MGERRGTKALELWCRRITEGYPGVNVQNMTTSWRDGLAFCAMIHHFRPDLVDFDSLNKDDVYANNELAFRTAEKHLGIPALLDAEDMASCAVPDRLSILTYLSQFYQTFAGLSPSRTAMKRTSEESDERLASVSGSPQPKVVGVRLGVQRKEPCVVCGLPVFLAEKLVISRSLYHRTCFRCARCNNQLTLGNYYETEEGQYCCETCPDEETAGSLSAPVMHQDYNRSAMQLPGNGNGNGNGNGGAGTPLEFHYRPPPSPTYKRALSDEEKSSKRAVAVAVAAASSATSKVRLNFMTSHLLAGNENDDDDLVIGRGIPDRNKSPSLIGNAEADSVEKEKTSRCTPRESSDDEDEKKEEKSIESLAASSRGDNREEDIVEVVNSEENSSLLITSNKRLVVESNKRKTTTNSNNDNDNNLLDVKIRTAGLAGNLNEDHTKERNFDVSNLNVNVNRVDKDGSERLSLVRQRLKIFENAAAANSEKESSSPSNNVVRDTKINVKIKSIGKEGSEKLIEDGKEKTPVNAELFSQNPQELSAKNIDDDRLSPTPNVSQVDSAALEPLKLEEKPPGCEEEEEKMEEKEKEKEKLFVDIIEEKEEEPRGGEKSLTEATGVDLSGGNGDYPEDLNPFQSEEEEDERPMPKKTPSTNPFGSDDEDEEIITPVPRPAARNNTVTGNDKNDAQPPTRRLLPAPQINLNPFWSDDDDDEEETADISDAENETGKPVPRPRTMRLTPEPSPVPRKTSLDRGGLYASNTSIGSTGSLITPGGTYRKKKPAPLPPTAQETFSPTSTFDTLVIRSPDDISSANIAPSRTPRTRKTKPAPPPPMSTSTPQPPHNFTDDFFPLEEKESAIWEGQKNSKDETNRNRQSLSGLPLDTDDPANRFSGSFVDKSAQGKWKRKKGPAPPRPIPHKRKIKVMSVKDIKLELDQIELQQQGLEKQGVRLEQLIRDKSETGQENEEFMSLRIDVEELVLELFALVNEKNELFRRQAELMLLRRQQRLEEEHADVEYQIRCLMSQPEATKTDSDKQREEVLIQRLVEVVERRNEIVECLEMDRRREVEEDRSINEQMGIFAAKSKGDLTASNDNVHGSITALKKDKSKDKVKEKKVKKSQKKDADKDVDETEMKLKRHKKKWF